MKVLLPKTDHSEEPTSALYLPDGSPYDPSRGRVTCVGEDCAEREIIVTGTFPRQDDSDVLVELIRDPHNPKRLSFLCWENGIATVHPHLERDGEIFLPPDPVSDSFPSLSLADGLLPCDGPAVLLAKIASTISKFVKLWHDQLLIVACFVLASWFADCFEVAPYLWVVGPLGSGKTTLLKLLWCMCRRGLIAGDLRSASVYKLVNAWHPTLIIDELELGFFGARAELFRLLRTGSGPGVPAFRNGQRFSTYGPKVIASRQPLGDAALLSRGVIVSLLPTEDDLLPLDELAMKQILTELQPKLLAFRLENFRAVNNFRISSDLLRGVTPRTKQIARALAQPLLGEVEPSSELLATLRTHDEEARIEHSLEPEWLVAESLFDLSHKGMKNGHPNREILVGAIAGHVNKRLVPRGEDLWLSAKKTGLALKSLGVCTERLGRMGRGVRFGPALRRQAHEIALQMGIDRRSIAPAAALEAGYGGVPCALCEELGLTGGLRFVEIRKSPRTRQNPTRRRLFDEHDDNGKNSEGQGEGEK